MKSGAIFLVLGVVLAATVLVAGNLRGGQAARVDEAAVARLLEDRSQPWFQGHQVPLPLKVHMHYTASELMGAFAEPPVKFPRMPVDLARHLTAGSKGVPAGHPFHGRPAVLFDMRLRSRHLQEHIPGGLQMAWKDLPTGLKAGELKDLARNTIVIVYGEVYPHFDAPNYFRAAGFDAVYCLEGGLRLWKERGFPVQASPDALALARQQEAERPGPLEQGQHGYPDAENIGPVALKLAMDQGLKPEIIFVGDLLTFEANRIPGAVRVEYKEIPATFEKADRDRLYLVYCGCCEGSAKGLSGLALAMLKKMGFRRVLHLEGHLKGWKDQGYPVDTGKAPEDSKPRNE